MSLSFVFSSKVITRENFPIKIFDTFFFILPSCWIKYWHGFCYIIIPFGHTTRMYICNYLIRSIDRTTQRKNDIKNNDFKKNILPCQFLRNVDAWARAGPRASYLMHNWYTSISNKFIFQMIFWNVYLSHCAAGRQYLLKSI